MTKFLHDESIMPIGKWKGSKLKEVSDSYWRWFIDQDWTKEEYPDLYRYAEIATGNEED